MEARKKKGLNLTAKGIAKVIHGQLRGDGDLIVDGISIDSRSINRGDLFIAIKGDYFDGHSFIGEAINKGAIGAIVEEGISMDEKKKQLDLLFKVEDTVKAYQDIAEDNRLKNSAKVVAVTGSSGKTTTKDMIGQILSSSHTSAIISEKNFNNYIGIPMTLLKIRDEHEVAVVEVGINQIDEMDRLASMTNPDIAIVTNAGRAHLEFLKNVDTVACEKMKIANGLKDDGTLIINCDDLRLLRCSEKKDVNKMSYGFTAPAHIKGESFEDIALNESRLKVRLKDGEEVTIPMKINGKHNAYNALAAIATATALNIPIPNIINGLKDFIPKDMRSEYIFLNDGIVVINDAYNANPDSMDASLTLFKDLKGAQKKIVVLGDMYELGDYSKKAHKDVGATVAGYKFDVALFYGKEMQEAAKAAGHCGMDKNYIYWFNNHDTLFDALCANINKGDWVIVKGSRLNSLEKIVAQLIEKIGVNEMI